MSLVSGFAGLDPLKSGPRQFGGDNVNHDPPNRCGRNRRRNVMPNSIVVASSFVTVSFFLTAFMSAFTPNPAENLSHR